MKPQSSKHRKTQSINSKIINFQFLKTFLVVSWCNQTSRSWLKHNLCWSKIWIKLTVPLQLLWIRPRLAFREADTLYCSLYWLITQRPLHLSRSARHTHEKKKSNKSANACNPSMLFAIFLSTTCRANNPSPSLYQHQPYQRGQDDLKKRFRKSKWISERCRVQGLFCSDFN